jgi:hypothetical protein
MPSENSHRIAFLSLASKYGKNPTDLQAIELQRRRQDLTRRFIRHTEDAASLFPGMDKGVRFGPTHIREPCACPEDEICGHMGLDIDPFGVVFETCGPSETKRSPTRLTDPTATERLAVPLPSSALTLSAFNREARQKEIQLRVAQAEEALQGIRREVGYKSFLFKANRRLLHTKDVRLRSYKVIADADREIRRHVRLYNLARSSLMRLSNDRVALSKFQEVKKADLKPLASIYGPNDAGGSRVAVSWLWSVQLGTGDHENSPYMTESESTVKYKFRQMFTICLSCPHQLSPSSVQTGSVARRDGLGQIRDVLDHSLFPRQSRRSAAESRRCDGNRAAGSLPCCFPNLAATRCSGAMRISALSIILSCN